jgi:hypothetical protein
MWQRTLNPPNDIRPTVDKDKKTYQEPIRSITESTLVGTASLKFSTSYVSWMNFVLQLPPSLTQRVFVFLIEIIGILSTYMCNG